MEYGNAGKMGLKEEKHWLTIDLLMKVGRNDACPCGSGQGCET